MSHAAERVQVLYLEHQEFLNTNPNVKMESHDKATVAIVMALASAILEAGAGVSDIGPAIAGLSSNLQDVGPSIQEVAQVLKK